MTRIRSALSALSLPGRRTLAVLVALVGLTLPVVPVAHAGSGSARAVEARATAAPVLTGVIVVTGSSKEPYAAAHKTATATCPAGKRIVGGGARTTTRYGGSTQGAVALSVVQPYSVYDQARRTYNDGYFTRADERILGRADGPGDPTNGPYPVEWILTARAICADYISGLQVVSSVGNDYGDRDNHFRATKRVDCGAGRSVLGTGGYVFGADSGFAGVSRLRSANDGKSVRILGGGIANSSRGLEAVVYAICARTPVGYQVVHGPLVEGDARRQSASASCGTDRPRVLTGAGLTVLEQEEFPHIWADAMFPSGRVTVGAGTTSNPQSWILAATAICVARSATNP